ncbi:hypothetical protein L2095_23605 [Bacillus zanthoxyli]|nr:hypothetical protein [Bacillus zanthoxyli]
MSWKQRYARLRSGVHFHKELLQEMVNQVLVELDEELLRHGVDRGPEDDNYVTLPDCRLKFVVEDNQFKVRKFARYDDAIIKETLVTVEYNGIYRLHADETVRLSDREPDAFFSECDLELVNAVLRRTLID